MLQQYSVQNGKIEQGVNGYPLIDIYIRPDESERRHLVDDCDIDEHTLLSSNDPDETPRVEIEDNHTAVILKYPKNYSAEDNFFFRVKSMGVFLFPAEQRIVIVVDDQIPLFTGRLMTLKTPQDVLLRILSQTIRHFETHLRIINMCSDELEHEINKPSGNKNQRDMFTLKKGLVYYTNALTGNQAVIDRLMRSASRIGFTEENREILEDQVIENHQFLAQARVYSEILTQLMATHESIINNNLNEMMKKMNAIVIAVSIPTFLTGVGGMSEFSAVLTDRKIHWAVGYPVFFGVMILLAYLIYWLIQRHYNSH